MITNATLTRLDRRTGTSATGQALYTTGGALAVGCFLDDPSSQQRWNLGATIKDATHCVFISKAALLAGGITTRPAAGDKFVVRAEDASVEVTGEVILVKDRIHGAVSHWELFLKSL